MTQENENTRTYVASFRKHNLRTWETKSGYLWEVTNAGTGEIMARGEAQSRENAMIDAAQAAGADWGNARWRSAGEEDED
jgi:hypothetical protein